MRKQVPKWVATTIYIDPHALSGLPNNQHSQRFFFGQPQSTHFFLQTILSTYLTHYTYDLSISARHNGYFLPLKMTKRVTYSCAHMRSTLYLMT